MSHWRGLWKRLRRGAARVDERNDDPEYQRDLAEFLAADQLSPQGDEGFRVRLREELWRSLVESRPPDPEGGAPKRRVDK